MSVTASLFVSGPDRRGLVAQISAFIFQNNGNILHSDHHIDAESGLFLNRVEFEIEGFKIPRAEIGARFAPVAASLGMEWSLRFSDEKQKVAVFVTKYDHCLWDLLLRARSGELRGEIALVVSNHHDLEPVAKQFGVPFAVFPITPETKRTQEEKEIAVLEEHHIDLIVLARYLQIFSSEFTARYPNRVINIHDSFLPAFIGARPYHRAYERGVKLIGATSHYVTDTLDDGPIIEQDVMRVSHRDSVADLMRKGRDLERIVLARAVKLHLEHRVLAYGRKTVVFD